MIKAIKKRRPVFVLPAFFAFIIGFAVPFAEALYLEGSVL